MAALPHWGCPTKEDAPTRLKTLREHLHADGSGREARKLFPDLTLVYTDDGHGNANFPPRVLPYKYYWSAEGQFTVSICAIDTTVFICPYKVDRLLKPSDWRKCDLYSDYGRAEMGMSRFE